MCSAGGGRGGVGGRKRGCETPVEVEGRGAEAELSKLSEAESSVSMKMVSIPWSCPTTVGDVRPLCCSKLSTVGKRGNGCRWVRRADSVSLPRICSASKDPLCDLCSQFLVADRVVRSSLPAVTLSSEEFYFVCALREPCSCSTTFVSTFPTHIVSPLPPFHHFPQPFCWCRAPH